MGSYLNPGNDGFRAIRNGGYVEKSGLIAYVNSTIEKFPDVLTILVHLGYVAYDGEKKEGYIPDLEVADAFRTAVKETDWRTVNQALARSDDLLRATIRKDSDAVAAALEDIHSAETSVLQYKDDPVIKTTRLCIS